MKRALFMFLFCFFSVLYGNEFTKTLIIGYEYEDKKYLSMGVYTKSGFIITSSDFFSKNNLEKDITVYVFDSKFTQPVCFMKASVKAVDFDRNVALLQKDDYLDIFCDRMDKESSYHRDFLENAKVDFFCDGCKYFPDILEPIKSTTLNIDGLMVSRGSENLGYYFKDENDLGYVVGFVVEPQPLYPGTPYFDKNGSFMGMYVFGKFSDIGFDGAISRGFITSYLCELENNSVIDVSHSLCVDFENSKLFGITEEK